MRVNYTLPGLLPAETTPAETGRTGDSPFRARLSLVPAPRWLNWKSLLRLEEPPLNAASIGPPPRPASFNVEDAATERLIWRQMLDRLVEAVGDAAPAGDSASGGDTQPVERMLALLMRFRDVEDAMAAQHLAEAES
jgi:hypothetical protein